MIWPAPFSFSSREPPMREIKTPNAQGGDALDVIQPGKVTSLTLDAGIATAFPPAADYPNGGLLSIRIPADMVVELRMTADGPGYQLDPGHWSLGFDEAEECFLVSTDPVTLAILASKEI